MEQLGFAVVILGIPRGEIAPGHKALFVKTEKCLLGFLISAYWVGCGEDGRIVPLAPIGR